jgi:hypothetical protein
LIFYAIQYKVEIFKKRFFLAAMLIGFLGFASKAQNASVTDSATVLIDSLMAQPPLLSEAELDSLLNQSAKILNDSLEQRVILVSDSLIDESGFQTTLPETPSPSDLQLDDEYKHSPHKASVYAAVFPGAGQIYNKKYWKVPLLYAGIGGLVYAIHFNSSYYNKYRSAYRDFLIRDPGNTSYEEFIPVGLTIEDVHGQYEEWFQRALQNKRRYYKRYRDISYIGMAALYLASIIDASVDAHFYDFDISDDLSLRVEPAVLSPVSEKGSAFGLQMRLQF